MAKGKVDLRCTLGRRRRFVAVLAETCDIDAAREASGLSWAALCELRVRHPDFAQRWDEAIAIGYDRLETRLLREAGAGGGALNPALAQALLKQRGSGRSEAAGARRNGKRPTPRERNRHIEGIVDQLTALQAAEAKGSPGHGKAAPTPPQGPRRAKAPALCN